MRLFTATRQKIALTVCPLGVCVSSAGYTCHPKKKPKIVTHDVVLYNINGSQVGSRQATACIQLFKFCKR